MEEAIRAGSHATRRMLNFGVRRDWIDANPASLITNPGCPECAKLFVTQHAVARVLVVVTPYEVSQ
jgi:hypothetical protein